MISLATVLSFIKIIRLPWDGSITLLSMLPIAVFSIRHGVKNGLAVSFVYSLIQFGEGVMGGLFGWGLTPISLICCIFLDYILAYTVIGISGIFKNYGFIGQTGGTALAIFLRFVLHFFSGVFIFHSFGELWTGFSTDNTWLYSLLYNGSYMLPEIIFTVIGAAVLLKIPQSRKILLNND